jgi:predicted nucleic acid-binding protein
LKQPQTVILDNEAVQALTDVRHRKHRRVLAIVEVAAARNLRRAGSVRLVVPTAVRVEAGWDRRMPSAAPINRLRVDDAPLDGATANSAARVASKLGLAVPDAHIVATLEHTPSPHAIVTSDVDDFSRALRRMDGDATVIRV